MVAARSSSPSQNTPQGNLLGAEGAEEQSEQPREPQSIKMVTPPAAAPVRHRHGAAEPENTQELGAAMVLGGVQISKTRGLTVDGEQHGAIKRDDLRFEPGALGAGACSVVRLARHTSTNQRYAVKLFAIFDDAKRPAISRGDPYII